MKAIIFFSLLVTLVSCGQSDNDEVNGRAGQGSTAPATPLLETIKQRGKLIVLTANLPTTYYFDRDNELAGPEYEMTQSFSESIGVEVEYKVYDSTKSLLAALRNNEGDLIASGLTVNDKRQQEFDFGPAYHATQEYLVCHRKNRKIKKAEDLSDVEVIIAADTNYLESIKAYPQMTWAIDDTLDTPHLIKEVADKNIECTVSDSTLYDIERRFYTEIESKFTFAKNSELAWLLNKNNTKLLQAITSWFGPYKESGDLAYMLEKYYGHVAIFDYVDTHKFLARVKTRFSAYEKLFIDAANKNNIKPSLLAAQSYQESHWDRKAKSPTGVRGIMMLTQPVAKSLGVTNRLDAKQNIYAGAKFLAKMKKMLADVEEPDKTWLALAAYNVGRGHFRDAQALAKKLDVNPDRWSEMMLVLPLLSQKKYYKNLRYGYARGNEPVRYVTRIRSYDALLNKHFLEQGSDAVVGK